jgi:hypothetical protein
MKKMSYAAFAVVFAALPVHAEELTVATAGDQNMVDYINQYLGPLFEKTYPGNTVRAVGTGPGDAGSQKILERFDAQAAAKSDKWDVDVAVVHEKFVGPMVTKNYLDKYRSDIETGKLVTRANAKMALGTNVGNRQARHPCQRQDGARHQCRRLCHADVQQPDRDRL